MYRPVDHDNSFKLYYVLVVLPVSISKTSSALEVLIILNNNVCQTIRTILSHSFQFSQSFGLHQVQNITVCVFTSVDDAQNYVSRVSSTFRSHFFQFLWFIGRYQI